MAQEAVRALVMSNGSTIELRSIRATSLLAS